ncbi:pre-peptidase C-terminal domain-containing protein [Methanofollis ethanolicus]|uniref:pre-peptidase C-terminal domain-containing protein n=1 Tax=Methanofollis ethanolicus TaxID=488124 RepID=UPI00128EAFCA|nr:pre-peptidase C-terminal domain-containing protein [Methanofollis ethanolicus]
MALIIAAVLTPFGAAQGTIAELDGYTIAPAADENRGLVELQRNDATISQGERDRYSHTVPSGTSQMNIDLNWGNSANSLFLTISAPTSAIGTFHDADDGAIDGRIHITISKSPCIEAGTWEFVVYGEKVSGKEDYTFGWI